MNITKIIFTLNVHYKKESMQSDLDEIKFS